MSVEESEGFLGIVGLKVRNKSTLIREAISKKSKLEITFRYLASGYRGYSLSLRSILWPVTSSEFVSRSIKNKQIK
jgi:hypothetical protein